jgi:hypothetical protein
MSVEIALRLFSGVRQALIVTGAIAIERQIRGRHVATALTSCASDVLAMWSNLPGKLVFPLTLTTFWLPQGPFERRVASPY